MSQVSISDRILFPSEGGLNFVGAMVDWETRSSARFPQAEHRKMVEKWKEGSNRTKRWSIKRIIHSLLLSDLYKELDKNNCIHSFEEQYRNTRSFLMHCLSSIWGCICYFTGSTNNNPIPPDKSKQAWFILAFHYIWHIWTCLS